MTASPEKSFRPTHFWRYWWLGLPAELEESQPADLGGGSLEAFGFTGPEGVAGVALGGDFHTELEELILVRRSSDGKA
jgi:hypothetical protein